MTREERYHKIDKAFPYEPMSSTKEDITRCLDNQKREYWVEWAIGILLVAALAAYLYQNYFRS